MKKAPHLLHHALYFVDDLFCGEEWFVVEAVDDERVHVERLLQFFIVRQIQVWRLAIL